VGRALPGPGDSYQEDGTGFVGAPTQRPVHVVGPDERLIRLAAGRQAWALTELYDRHQAAAFGLALWITGDAFSAAAAVERSFLEAWRCAAVYRSRVGTVRAWILGMVQREAIAALRGAFEGRTVPEPGSRSPLGREMDQPNVPITMPNTNLPNTH